MNMYSVVPNPSVTTWFVKLEDVAPEKEFNSEDEAIASAEQMAKENSPSIVKIMDKDHKVVEEKRF